MALIALEAFEKTHRWQDSESKFDLKGDRSHCIRRYLGSVRSTAVFTFK